MPIKNWSITAGNNTAAPPYGAPEGMAPSTVNDTMRQMMADVRSDYENREFRDLGHVPTYSSATTFTIPTDVTAIYHAYRRIRASVTAGSVYGTIQSASYASPNTTVTVTWDSGSLDTGLSAVALGLAAANQCVHAKGITSTKPDGTLGSVQDAINQLASPLNTVSASVTLATGDFPSTKNVTGTATLTLPSASSVVAGLKITIKSTTTGNVLIAPSGTDTLDGLNANVRVPSYDTYELMSNGSNGYVILRKGMHAVGDILHAGVAGTRTDTLIPNGSAVSRTTYAGLFAVFGTIYGAGDGSTTFNLPNYMGRALINAGQGTNLSNRTVGDTGGEETHTLSANEMPAHSHGIATEGWGGSINNASSQMHAFGGSAAPTTDNTNSAGSGSAHNNMQPFAVAQFLIKT